jgi:N-acyl-L-homoserine lactone synthetase
MVIVLEGTERRRYHKYFDRLFRLRHQIFVKGRGWSLPSVNDCEIDQYDVDDAVYLLDLNDEDVIQGSVRMTPSERCSLLADYFPHLVENGESPRSPLVYECTRYIVLPAQKSREANRAAKARLLGAAVEWSLNHGLAYLQTVIDSVTLSSFVEMTPQTIPLGLSHPYGGGRKTPGGGECMAIRWPISQQVLDDILGYGGLDRRAREFSDSNPVDRRAPVELVH